jgi:hypothetical protein
MICPSALQNVTANRCHISGVLQRGCALRWMRRRARLISDGDRCENIELAVESHAVPSEDRREREAGHGAEGVRSVSGSSGGCLNP